MEIYENDEKEKLKRLLSVGTSAALTVAEVKRQLTKEGFQELVLGQDWELARGRGYFLVHHDTTMFAFTLGEEAALDKGFRMAAAHTDFPCLRVKTNPEIATSGYGQLNVEIYGSPILSTWMDRPLGLGGRVALKSQEVMKPQMRLVDIRTPLAVVPNLAIHMNRETNKGVELNRQTDLLPILGTIEKEWKDEKHFLHFLAEHLQVKMEDILDFELWLTCLQEPMEVGIRQDFLVSPRLDNLTSVQALVTALIAGRRQEGVNLIALFDHEEVGSRSKQGASSLLLNHVLEKIGFCLGGDSIQVREAMYRSFLLSADVAQGCHPNHMDKADLTNHAVLNQGFCIKEACSQSYATDCEAVATVEQICQKWEIPYQKYVNRSDIAGGGTLGAIASCIVPVPTVDVGVPLLAMHSAVETMGIRDQTGMTRMLAGYFGL